MWREAKQSTKKLEVEHNELSFKVLWNLGNIILDYFTGKKLSMKLSKSKSKLGGIGKVKL